MKSGGLTGKATLLVAPFTGAWIEILLEKDNPALYEESHPSRVRGLKSEPS